MQEDSPRTERQAIEPHVVAINGHHGAMGEGTEMGPQVHEPPFTHRGFLVGVELQERGQVRLELEALDGTREPIEVTVAQQTLQVIRQILSVRPCSWFNFSISEDGRILRFNNEPVRAPRNETVRGFSTSMYQRFHSDDYFAIALHKGRVTQASLSIALRRDPEIVGELMKAIQSMALIEVDVDQGLAIQRIRWTKTPEEE